MTKLKYLMTYTFYDGYEYPISLEIRLKTRQLIKLFENTRQLDAYLKTGIDASNLISISIERVEVEND